MKGMAGPVRGHDRVPPVLDDPKLLYLSSSLSNAFG